MRAVVKSHKYLKGTKVFAFGCLVRNFKKKFSLFVVKLQPGIVYKKSQSKGYLGNFIKKRRLYRDSYTNTFLKVLKKLWTRLWTPLRDCLWNNVKKRVCYLKFSHVFLIKKCSSLHQNNSHHSGGAW